MKSLIAKIGAIGTTMALAATSVYAAGEAVIPDAGVDVSSYITSGITKLGAVVAVAVGGYACFFLIKKALRWFSTAIK